MYHFQRMREIQLETLGSGSTFGKWTAMRKSIFVVANPKVCSYWSHNNVEFFHALVSCHMMSSTEFSQLPLPPLSKMKIKLDHTSWQDSLRFSSNNNERHVERKLVLLAAAKNTFWENRKCDLKNLSFLCKKNIKMYKRDFNAWTKHLVFASSILPFFSITSFVFHRFFVGDSHKKSDNFSHSLFILFFWPFMRSKKWRFSGWNDLKNDSFPYLSFREKNIQWNLLGKSAKPTAH